jgi:hypothetical protein
LKAGVDALLSLVLLSGHHVVCRDLNF